MKMDLHDNIVCRHVYKKYGSLNKSVWVLNGLSITITKGKIFSLLGPSGSGKTTLLKCILGKISIDSGSISVFGKRPKVGPWIGYMPQIIALSHKLTVQEILTLYSHIANMKQPHATKRIQFLLGLLDMTDYKDLPLGTLSGGEQRRISFSVAVLRQPRLLILDEPTVGVDPALRHTIWQYLKCLVRSSNVTVILTTHYIEEAKHSDYVSFVSDGRLLENLPPTDILTKYNCSSLESVFVRLCEVKNEEATSCKNTLEDSKSSSCCGKLWQKLRLSSMLQCQFLIPLMKMWHLEIFRSPWLIVLQLIIPALVIVLVPMAVDDTGFPRRANIGVVNLDTGTIGKQYLQTLDANIFQMRYYRNYEEALHDCRMGKTIGVIMFKQNFTNALLKKYENVLLTDAYVKEQSGVYVAFDENDISITSAVSSQLSTVFQTVLDQLKIDPSHGQLPLMMTNEMTHMSPDNKFSYPTPGIVLCMCIIIFSSISGVLLNITPQEGLLERLYIAGVSSFETFLSLTILQVFIGVGFTGMTMLVLFFINHLTCNGSYWMIALVIFCQILTGISIGVVIAAISVNIQMTYVLLAALMVLSLVLQGPSILFENMAPTMRAFIMKGPTAMSVVALRGILNFDWPIGHHSVVAAFGTNFAWISTSFVISIFVFRLRE